MKILYLYKYPNYLEPQGNLDNAYNDSAYEDEKYPYHEGFERQPDRKDFKWGEEKNG